LLTSWIQYTCQWGEETLDPATPRQTTRPVQNWSGAACQCDWWTAAGKLMWIYLLYLFILYWISCSLMAWEANAHWACYYIAFIAGAI